MSELYFPDLILQPDGLQNVYAKCIYFLHTQKAVGRHDLI